MTFCKQLHFLPLWGVLLFSSLLPAQESSVSNLPPVIVSDDLPRPEQPAPPVRRVITPEPAPVEAPAPAPVTDSLTVPTVDEVRDEMSLQAGGVSVIDASDYLSGRATTLKDALDYAPGVLVQPRFGSEEARLSIRGSGIQRTFHGRGIKLMQDGVPLNLADGGFDFQAIDPLVTQYIEVYRGANALEYGGTTLGGAINFVSPTGRTAAPLQMRAEYGSFNSLRGQISGATFDENSDAYASLTHSSTDGFRDHAKQSNQRFFSHFGEMLAPNVETRFYITYARSDSELPGDLTKAQLNANPEQAFRNPFFLDADRVVSNWKRDYELFRVANKTTWDHGDAQFSVGSFWSNKDLDHPIIFVIDQVSNDFGLDLRYENDADWNGRENHFVLGFAPTVGVTDDARFDNVLGERGVKIAENYQTSMNLDLYGQNSHYFQKDLALVAGAQLSYARRDSDDNFPVTLLDPNNSGTQDWIGFSPKVGLLWEATEDTQVFANVSRSFEPPSFGELVNAVGGAAGLLELDEQTATTFEIGTRSHKEGVAWDVAYYYGFVNDELLQYQVLPGVTQTVNADNTIHQGIEASLDLDLIHGVTHHDADDKIVFRQNYLWNDFRFDNDATFGDNQLPGIPEHYYRAEFLYEHPSGIYFGPNVEWVPTAYAVDSASTLFTDPYALLGFKVGYRNERFTAFIEAKNLTDEIYAASTSVVNVAGPANSAVFQPGDGRGVYAGFEWKF